ncbi:MAG TPA: thiamine phosphate synthase [Solirubrobacteraceae bacterium]|jgi:thiamine-phosphate pyrophosphorylase|nr:thiamine phosphate synthase [Solirubrobacteraceae bacterium]
MDLGADRRARLGRARLYLVCDASPGGRPLAEVLPSAIAGGVDVVQLREKGLADGELVEAARGARALCEPFGVLLIVNDRPDLALAAGADGAHVGQDDVPPPEARELLGPELLLGLSTHAPAEIEAASDGAPAGEGVDYIGVGPVYATPTKAGRAAVGLELVRYAAERARAPFFAIGGIDAENVAEVLGAGARRVAVVRAIAHAPDPEAAARALRGALEEQVVGA